ncbi:FxLYD domain-containing protein [Spartinivicinus marinus]|uniref:FxLYD domain-containing protein n=1 Tax=Spartinivicinus marinus TaxID=2994442 RepID=UPI001C5CB347
MVKKSLFALMLASTITTAHAEISNKLTVSKLNTSQMGSLHYINGTARNVTKQEITNGFIKFKLYDSQGGCY